MDETRIFTEHRPRLLRVAGRILGDPAEAEDIVQNVWLRLHRSEADICNLPGWLTTVTTRLCLDRLRARTAFPDADLEIDDAAATDPADEIALADTVAIALNVVLDRLTPSERVAFVLHDSFGFDFPTIADLLGRTPVAARKLASRARSKIGRPATEDQRADWVVVDAFLTAARQGDFTGLLRLLAPDAVVVGDAAAIAMGTPARVEGDHQVAKMFNGAAKAALPVFIEDRPGAAWFHRTQLMVAFDFTIADGVVQCIEFRADPGVLSQVVRRHGAS